MTTFNDILFAQRAFQQLVNLLTPLNAFSSDISDEVVKPGSTVVCPLFGALTTTTFSDSTTNVMEQTGGTISAVTVTLDKRRIVPVSITSQDLADSSNANRVEMWGEQLSLALANTVLSDVFSVVTTTNFGAAVITSTSASWDQLQLIQARAKLNGAGVPLGRRSLICNRAIESSLLGDTKLASYFAFAAPGAVRDGNLGQVMGMNIYGSDVLPTNSISLTGFACGQDGIAIAFRNIGNFLPPEEYAALEVMTEPQTGLSAVYTRHWSRAQARWYLNLQCLYGYSVAVTKAVKVFTTATA